MSMPPTPLFRFQATEQAGMVRGQVFAGSTAADFSLVGTLRLTIEQWDVWQEIWELYRVEADDT